MKKSKEKSVKRFRQTTIWRLDSSRCGIFGGLDCSSVQKRMNFSDRPFLVIYQSSALSCSVIGCNYWELDSDWLRYYLYTFLKEFRHFSKHFQTNWMDFNKFLYFLGVSNVNFTKTFKSFTLFHAKWRQTGNDDSIVTCRISKQKLGV